MEISCVKEVEQNPVPKSQAKPFYIGTKEAPSGVGNENISTRKIIITITFVIQYIHLYILLK